MGINKVIIIGFLFFNLKSFSQVKLYPKAGIAFANCRMLNPSKVMMSYQMESSQFWGLDLRKTILKHELGVNFTISDVNLQAKTYSQTLYGRNRGRSAIGTAMHLYGFNYSYELADIKFLKIKPKTIRGSTVELNEYFTQSPRYFASFKFKPIASLNLNYVTRTNWTPWFLDDSASSNNIDTSSFDPSGTTLSFGKDDWDMGEYGSSKIVKNKFGVSLNLGFELQFYNQNRNKVCMGFLYNQGFTNLLGTSYNKYLSSDGGQTYVLKRGYFASRGSFLSMYLTYPITLVNKKGERRIDRKSL